MSRAVIALLVVASVAIASIAQGGTLLGAIRVTEALIEAQAGPPPGVVEFDDPDLGTAQSYYVDFDGTLDPEPPPGSREAEVWATFLRVTSATYAGKVIGDYTVGDNPRGETAAYVAKYEGSPYWTLAVNLADSDKPDLLIPTLIHEYAHLLSLGRDQVDEDVVDCATIDLWEGCLRESSALWAFAQRFWNGHDDAPDPENAEWDEADRFYAAHEDEFVSDYAAMNVVEDFAESFMVYVMEEPPTGETIAADKLRFFAEMPAYAAIRDRIRLEFADDFGWTP